jgi:hypothetical protein
MEDVARPFKVIGLFLIGAALTLVAYRRKSKKTERRASKLKCEDPES